MGPESCGDPNLGLPRVASGQGLTCAPLWRVVAWHCLSGGCGFHVACFWLCGLQRSCSSLESPFVRSFSVLFPAPAPASGPWPVGAPLPFWVTGVRALLSPSRSAEPGALQWEVDSGGAQGHGKGRTRVCPCTSVATWTKTEFMPGCL